MLETFQRRQIFFLRFAGDISKMSHKILFSEMYLRRLKDATKRHLFLDVFETPQRRHEKFTIFEMFLRGL